MTGVIFGLLLFLVFGLIAAVGDRPQKARQRAFREALAQANARNLVEREKRRLSAAAEARGRKRDG